jgi:hypothetical protein
LINFAQQINFKYYKKLNELISLNKPASLLNFCKLVSIPAHLRG